MVNDKSTTMNRDYEQSNVATKKYENYVAAAAEKLRQRLIEMQAQKQRQSTQGTEQKHPLLPNEIRHWKEQLKAQLEQAEKYCNSTVPSEHVTNGYPTNEMNKETENVSISTHSKELIWDNKKEMNYHNVESLEKEIALLRENLAKYQNVHSQSIGNKDTSHTALHNYSQQHNTSDVHIEYGSNSGESKSNGYYQDKFGREEQDKIPMESAQQKMFKAQEEYENVIEKLPMASISQANRKTTDCQTVENSLDNGRNHLFCPLHEYFNASAPHILKLDSYLQSSAKESMKQITRLVQHSSIQEIKEMLFFCVDRLVQQHEEQQEEQNKISSMEQTLERIQLENNEKIQQQQEIENKLRDELERLQMDLSKAELALDVALSEKLVLENRTPAMELCETLESRLEKLESRRNKQEKELHDQIVEKNHVIEDLKQQISSKDKETNRLYAEVQHLLQNVEQLREMWTRQHRQQSRSKRKM